MPGNCQGRLPVARVKYSVKLVGQGGLSRKIIGGQNDRIGDARAYRGTHQNLELNACA